MMTSKYIHYYDQQAFALHIFSTEALRFWSLDAKKYEIYTNHDSAQVKDRIYISGGFSAEKCQYLSKTLLLDIKDGQNPEAIPRANMILPKSQHKLVAFNTTTLYSLGGRSKDQSFLTACERYDIPHDKWTKEASLNEKKLNVTACSFECKELFVYGGFNKTFLATIEAIRPAVDHTWKIIKVQGEWGPRDKAGCFQAGAETICIFGGVDAKGECTDDVFFMHVPSQSIHKSPQKLARREWFSNRCLVRIRDTFNVVGHFTKDIHVFNCSQQYWRLIEEADWTI